jgi:hypothetical protein
MSTIISASRRTDLPAFHAERFIQDVKKGYVELKHPNSSKYQRSLLPEDVLCFVFWTKNVRPLLKYLPWLTERGYSYYFQYSINNYPGHSIIEPRVPALKDTVGYVEEIERMQKGLIRWRYDTILITDECSVEWHLKNFKMLCEKMSPYTRDCIFSFCDFYGKVENRLIQNNVKYWKISNKEKIEMADKMADLAAAKDIQLLSCAHDFLVSGKIKASRCIDSAFIGGLVSDGKKDVLESLVKDPSQRKECGCMESIDIGRYNSCKHGCVYCYATE